MVAEQLRKLRNAYPFQPFCICMSDGQNFEITQPELFAISPVDDTVLVIDSNDDFHILQIPLIKELLVGTVAAAPSK